jgi:hypothetical protein
VPVFASGGLHVHFRSGLPAVAEAASVHATGIDGKKHVRLRAVSSVVHPGGRGMQQYSAWWGTS